MHDRQTVGVTRTRPSRWPALFGGGPAGNEELTAITGVLLIGLLAVLGVTILRIRQLIWLHLFLGLLLIGPVVLKIASTGYRFVRHYSRNALYRVKGPPKAALRALGPVLVVSTMVVFISGIALMLAGPTRRNTPLLIHKASFFIWLAVTALHVLGHLPGLSRSLRAVSLAAPGIPPASGAGTAGRWIVLTGAVVAGAVLAVALIPHYSPWTTPGAFPHHHEH